MKEVMIDTTEYIKKGILESKIDYITLERLIKVIKKGNIIYFHYCNKIYASAVISSYVKQNSLYIVKFQDLLIYKVSLVLADFNELTNLKLSELKYPVRQVTRRSRYENEFSHYIENGVFTQMTKKAYSLDIRQFLQYCTYYNLDITNPGILITYSDYLSNTFSNSSINRKIVSIKRFLIQENINNFNGLLTLMNKKTGKFRIINLDDFQIIE